ncbi:hypothetical protein MesoLjLb_33370 [Mesorhizobium sp. L-8-3]|nr:hypothetical protein MesoLjLb_33370 [Mesorhizobium sp. L-8-3]
MDVIPVPGGPAQGDIKIGRLSRAAISLDMGMRGQQLEGGWNIDFIGFSFSWKQLESGMGRRLEGRLEGSWKRRLEGRRNPFASWFNRVMIDEFEPSTNPGQRTFLDDANAVLIE